MKSEGLRKLKEMDYQVRRRIGGDQKRQQFTLYEEARWKRYAERNIEMEESSPAQDYGGWMNVGRRCSSGAAATCVGGAVPRRAETVRDVEREN
ncbi:hypothetical protein Csa_006205 [Cucumis sativus]|uniref:Uncharacterized protein n=1 Tax=Cucumis sativus TaxID=3659 RepID=A0A0A0LP56_CUCSA|nr:hypothetical protein Csa_006205 [Cucumis sativus]